MTLIARSIPHNRESSAESSAHVGTPGSSPELDFPSQDTPIPSIETDDARQEESPPLPSLTELGNALDEAALQPSSQRAALSPTPEPSLGLTPVVSPRRRQRSSSNVPAVPHRVEDEDLPEDLFNAQSFQDAFKEAKEAMRDLADALGSGLLHGQEGSRIRELWLKAIDLANFQHPATRTVGFVGTSGVGKSSLINSLLDMKSLGRSSNSGAACTCVATEYHYHSRPSFKIEVQLWTEDELVRQLQDMLQSYRQFHSHSYDDTEAARKDCEDRAKMADDTFKALFSGRLNNSEFLKSDSESDILKKFEDWIHEIRPVHLLQPTELDTLKTCSTFLMHLASEKAVHDEPAAWPYIRKIKVFCNAHILSKGLILADLPGLGDLNAARRNVTERFLRECDEIFVVCNIGRAVTDSAVEDVFKLALQAKQERLRNVGIVCTKSEDIDADEARNDSTGAVLQQIVEFQHTINGNNRELREIEHQLSDFDFEFYDELSAEEKDDYNSLKKEKKEITTQINQVNFQLDQFLINNRNQDVTGRLLAQYEEYIPDNALQVYCVSNRHYWKERDSDRSVSLPYLELSGILRLRKHCISIVSAAQYEAAVSFMRNCIPAHIANVGLWVESGAPTLDDERKESIRRVCGELEERLARDLQSGSAVVTRLSRSMQQQFHDNIFSAQNAVDWKDKAGELASVWYGWHHATYAAYCRHFGHYCSGVKGGHNWNAEIVQGMADELTTPWDSMDESATSEHDAIVGQVMTLVDELIEYLETELGVSANEVVLLRRVLQNEQSLLFHQIFQAFNTFDAELFQLRVNTFSGIRTSFVGRAMERAYRDCQNEGGTGSDRRRKAIIEGAAVQTQLFTNIIRQSRADFITLADTLGLAAIASVDTYLAKVRSSLDIIRDQNVASESGSDPAFRVRVEEAASVADSVMSDIMDRV